MATGPDGHRPSVQFIERAVKGWVYNIYDSKKPLACHKHSTAYAKTEERNLKKGIQTTLFCSSHPIASELEAECKVHGMTLLANQIYSYGVVIQ